MAFIVHPPHHTAGLAGRTAILGPDHVATALANEHDLIEFHHLLGHECSYAQVWPRDGLPRGVRSLVVVAMTAVLTPSGDSLRAHLRGAVINGVGRPELRQLMATVSFYLGAGIGTEVIAVAAAELGGLKPGDEGYAFGDAQVLGSREVIRERGAAMRQRMFGECPNVQPESALRDAEAAHELMKTEYLFGVVWSHPDMPATTRVLVVIGILCASGRMASLAQYLRAARNLGCSWDEVKEVFLTAFVYCGESAAEAGFRLAREIFEPPRIAN
jgi:4-carboxymuconolactone decarboxylase